MDESLRKKLTLDRAERIAVLNKPDDVHELDGLAHDERPDGQYDMALQFVFGLGELERAIVQAAETALIKPGGYLCIAYPKRGNKRYAEAIDRDDLIARFDLMEGDRYVLGMTLKFSKMLSLSDVFTVISLRNYPDRDYKPARAGASVDDYIEKIPALREALSDRPEMLELYDALPYGYQKDWAREVYSAKTEPTREKRLLEMMDLLAAGYRSKALSRRAKGR